MYVEPVDDFTGLKASLELLQTTVCIVSCRLVVMGTLAYKPQSRVVSDLIVWSDFTNRY